MTSYQVDNSITWCSNDENVATVDGDGLVAVVTALNPGTAVITVTTNEGGFTATCTVTVELIFIDYDVFLDKDEITLKVGETWTLTAMVAMPDWMDKSVKWSSSDKFVATVDGNGAVTGISEGTAVITVTTNEGGFTATCTVTVTTDRPVYVDGIALDKNMMILALGKTGQIAAKISPSDATNKSVKWSSSNKAVATIDENGLVTAVSVGQITISVTTADGNFRAFCTVKVMASSLQPTGVALDKSAMTLPVYSTGQVTATVSPIDAANKNIMWSSSNRMVANVDATGKITGITGGTATITATTADGDFTATCIVTVTVPVKGVTLDNTSMTIDLHGVGKLTATVSPTNATNKDVMWSSDNRMIVNVDADGGLTGIAPGTAIVTATTVNGGFTAACIVKVISANVPMTGVSIDPPLEITLKQGETLQITATVSP